MAQRARKGLATWLTSSVAPLFVLNHRGVVLVFNHGCEELTGWEAGEVIGKRCLQRVDANSNSPNSITAALAPPEKVYAGEVSSVSVMLPVQNRSAISQLIHYFPIPQSEDESEFRILGVIAAPDATARSETVSTLKQKFELASLFWRAA